MYESTKGAALWTSHDHRWSWRVRQSQTRLPVLARAAHGLTQLRPGLAYSASPHVQKVVPNAPSGLVACANPAQARHVADDKQRGCHNARVQVVWSAGLCSLQRAFDQEHHASEKKVANVHDLAKSTA